MRILALASLLVLGPLAAAAAPSAPEVVEATMATGIADRLPSGPAAAFPSSVGELYCWTRIVGLPAGSRIEHVWYRGDREVYRHATEVGGSNWRTWSRKSIPRDGAGPWRVEVVGPGGKLLRTLNFEVR